MNVQYIDPRVSVGPWNYHVTEISNKTNKYNEIDTATLTVLPMRNELEPEEQEEVEVEINGERIFTGFVGDVKDNRDGTYEITAFNQIHKLKVNNINVNVSNYMSVSKLLENHVFPKANIDNYEINLIDTASILYGVKNIPPFDNRVTMDRNNTPAAQIVDDLAKLANAVWWVNSENKLIFGSPHTQVQQLEYITDTSKGKTTPPYRSVKVVGDNVVSRGGWQDRNMVSKEPTVAARSIDIEGDGKDYAVRQELLPPTFVYKSKDIKTQKQAETIAERVAEKLIQQTKSGWVECVGRPDLEVYDVIEMPEMFGGERYLVSGVEHTITNNDGYITRINVGGLISP